MLVSGVQQSDSVICTHTHTHTHTHSFSYFFPKWLIGGRGLVAKSYLTLVIPWTVACQAPLSMGFSRRKYWSGLPFPSQEDLPYLGIKSGSPALQADSLPTEL